MKNVIRVGVKYILILFLMLAAFGCKPVNNKETSVIPMILDTDMETDVDDVGALAIIHALADRGQAKILGVISCAKNPWSILCAERINTYYNRNSLPLGQIRKPGVDRKSRYARQITEEFPGNIQSFIDVPDAVKQYRNILSTSPDNSVLILSIGYLTNLRDLLASQPDEYSNMSGKELVKQKVRAWICMGGQFPSGREANIRWDTDASIEAIENWPTMIIFSGWEIGIMDTGGKISKLPESNPIRRAYELFGRIPHKSWDQVATLFAVQGFNNGPSSHFWELSEPGRIVIDINDGSNVWEKDPDGKHRYLIQVGSDEEISVEIDALMMYMPHR